MVDTIGRMLLLLAMVGRMLFVATLVGGHPGSDHSHHDSGDCSWDVLQPNDPMKLTNVPSDSMFYYAIKQGSSTTSATHQQGRSATSATHQLKSRIAGEDALLSNFTSNGQDLVMSSEDTTNKTLSSESGVFSLIFQLKNITERPGGDGRYTVDSLEHGYYFITLWMEDFDENTDLVISAGPDKAGDTTISLNCLNGCPVRTESQGSLNHFEVFTPSAPNNLAVSMTKEEGTDEQCGTTLKLTEKVTRIHVKSQKEGTSPFTPTLSEDGTMTEFYCPSNEKGDVYKAELSEAGLVATCENIPITTTTPKSLPTTAPKSSTSTLLPSQAAVMIVTIVSVMGLIDQITM